MEELTSEKDIANIVSEITQIPSPKLKSHMVKEKFILQKNYPYNTEKPTTK